MYITDNFLTTQSNLFFASADVENMAIDWLTGNMYFVDRVAGKIFVCDHRGDTCVTILQLDLLNPKGIALDPLMGWVHCSLYNTAYLKALQGSFIIMHPLLMKKKIMKEEGGKNHYA